MADPRLIEYIKENLAKGHSLEEIRSFVTDHGWTGEEIDEALLQASGRIQEEGPKPAFGAPERPVRKKGRKKLYIAIIVFVILLIVLMLTASQILDYFLQMYPDNVALQQFKDLLPSFAPPS
jgi:hypothetical protein